MTQTRRRFVVGASAAVAGALAPSSVLGESAAPNRTTSAPPARSRAPGSAPARPLTLPRWSYGKGSFADDTVLMFRGNPAHTFYGTGPVPDNPRLLWKFRTADLATMLRGKPVTWSGTGWTGTAAKLGRYVFFGSVGGYVYALEAMTGKLAWSYRGGRMFKGSVCIYDNKLYIGNVDDNLRCLDAATGKVVWRHNTGRDLDSSPCVVDGVLYIAGENGYVRALDPATGKLKWKTFVGGIGPGTKPGSNGSETSPAIADGELYTATYDGILFCLRTRDGSIKWKTRTHDDTDASPVVAGDFVYAASEERASYLYGFERGTGREVWRYGGNRAGYWSTPAVVGNRIWIGGEDGAMHCVDALSGKPVWTHRTDAPVWSSPCVVDGKVIFGSRDAHLYVLDAATGGRISRHKVAGRIISSPCIVDGYIWIGTATGWFYCFGA